MKKTMYALMNSRIRTAPYPGGQVVGSIPYYETCEFLGEEQTVERNGRSYRSLKISFNGITGWVYAPLLEMIVAQDSPGIVDISEVQTVDPFDLAQYVDVGFGVAHNYCGPLCYSFLSGMGIVEMLEKLKVHNYALWRAIAVEDLTLGLASLDIMLAMSGYKTERVRASFSDDVVGYIQSPGRFASIIDDGGLLIAGVSIDAGGQVVARSGIAHWVVVTRVLPHGVNHGFVEFFNPACNDFEEMGYRDFIRSMDSWKYQTGVWVYGSEAVEWLSSHPLPGSPGLGGSDCRDATLAARVSGQDDVVSAVSDALDLFRRR